MNGLSRRLRRSFCSLLPTLGIVGAGPAAALSLTPVSVSSYTEAYTCSAFRCERNGVTGTGNQTAYAPNTSATATLKWGAAPVITTTSTADLQTGVGSGPDPVSSRSGASMTLIYQMQLQGPSSISLPVVMHTSGQLKLTGSNLDGEVGFATLSLKILGDQNGAMNPIYREYLHISSRDIGPTGTLALPFDEKSVVLRNVGLAPKGTADPYIYISEAGTNFHTWLKAPGTDSVSVITNHRRKSKDEELVFSVTATP